MFNTDWLHIISILSWLNDHAHAWWQNALDLITNDIRGTPTASQSELALIILMLFILFLTNINISYKMIRRHPLLFLDRALLAREVVLAVLWGTTLWAFYTMSVIPAWTRISIYASIAFVGIFINIALEKENAMSAEEVERERLEMLEKIHHDYD